MIGTDRTVGHRWQTKPSHGPWANWTSIGGYITGNIDVNLNAQGHLGVCGTGGDGNKWCNYHTKPYGSPWTGWHRA